MAQSSRDQSRRSRPDQSPESFESLHRRNAAAELLASYDKLSWLAYQRCESIVHTRIYLQNIVAGFDPEDEDVMPKQWRESLAPHPPKPGEKSGKSRSKSKEGVSSGAGGQEPSKAAAAEASNKAGVSR